MATVRGQIIVNTPMRATQLLLAWTEGARGGHKVESVRPLDVDSESVGLYSMQVSYTAKTKATIDDIGQRSEIVFGYRHAVRKL